MKDEILKEQEQIKNQLETDLNPEINDMHLVWENYETDNGEEEIQLMICSNQKSYMVFDERDNKESTLLRKVTGGHQEEITIMEYDFHLSLVATGCINGEITLYEFEMSRALDVLLGHDMDITALCFLSPFPLLLSASMD